MAAHRQPIYWTGIEDQRVALGIPVGHDPEVADRRGQQLVGHLAVEAPGVRQTQEVGEGGRSLGGSAVPGLATVGGDEHDPEPGSGMTGFAAIKSARQSDTVATVSD